MTDKFLIGGNDVIISQIVTLILSAIANITLSLFLFNDNKISSLIVLLVSLIICFLLIYRSQKIYCVYYESHKIIVYNIYRKYIFNVTEFKKIISINSLGGYKIIFTLDREFLFAISPVDSVKYFLSVNDQNFSNKIK